jgi:hypothetical protein
MDQRIRNRFADRIQLIRRAGRDRRTDEMQRFPQVAVPVTDWSFATDIGEVELQLTSQSRSRTTWILVHEGEAYVPCSLGFPPGKSWYRDALTDGRAMLRIDGKRYPVTLTKLDDAAADAIAPVIQAEVERKYGRAPPSDAGVWLFRVASRAPAS